jgi:hypothetical protein
VGRDGVAVSLTPNQIAAINVRLTATCTDVEVRRWAPMSRAVEVSWFARRRLIETAKIDPGGRVTVLA